MLGDAIRICSPVPMLFSLGGWPLRVHFFNRISHRVLLFLMMFSIRSCSVYIYMIVIYIYIIHNIVYIVYCILYIYIIQCINIFVIYIIYMYIIYIYIHIIYIYIICMTRV